ncbi:MAG: DUF1254 domain-containing protein [Burkholderiales bacterium]|nr:DUF1254 domain-containing protein [Burkholderiales bacterium]
MQSRCPADTLVTARGLLATVVLLMVLAAGASAQTEPLGGQPAPGSKASVPDLEEQVVYQRAFEAVIWSQPAVEVYRIRKGAEALGIKDNDVMAMAHTLGPQDEFLTANNSTPYIMANADLRAGPVVLEVPPASKDGVLYGQVVDSWQETIAGVGPSGLDRGKGGKYLFLPPGYKGEMPAGYLAVHSPSNRIQFAFRSIKLPGMTDAQAHAYSHKLQMYPLADAGHPKPTRFVDPGKKRIATLPRYDFTYFQDIYGAVSDEPVRPRDKAMMGMLKTLGIEVGKPFSPPLKYKAAMERAVVDAYFYMQQRFFEVQAHNLYWPNRHWSYYFLPDAQNSMNYDLPDGLFYTQRADNYHGGIYYAPGIPRLDQVAAWAKEGRAPATVYLASLADSEGRPLEAGKTYRLRVPANMPVKQFWSLIVYDVATWAFIYSPLERVGLSSYDVPNMKKNADGSVDLYFGPKPPPGLESNWIPTQGKRPMPIIRIYGGTEAFWDRTFVMPDVELLP